MNKPVLSSLMQANENNSSALSIKMRRVKITVSYIGTLFSGWQLQLKPGGPELRSVQGVLEKALLELLGHAIRVHGAGRTDAGVHADAQVAHFDVPFSTPNINWVQALNRILPDDVSLVDSCNVDGNFNARFDAKGKIYNYGLWLERRFVPARLKPFVWDVGYLELESMDRAVNYLLGEFDFASFQNAGAEQGKTVRKLYSIERSSFPLPGTAVSPADLYPLNSPVAYTVFTFYGSGFLKQMVRNLMGLLVAVGQGRAKAEDIPYFISTRDRRKMPGATAPARGLSLHRVLY